MYDNNPESYFMDMTRKVSHLYHRHALGQLKKEFWHMAVITINKICNENKGLFLLSYSTLKQFSGPKRKTKRQNHEAPIPTEIDINFLKELQYAQKDSEIWAYLEEQKKEHEIKLEETKKSNTSKECPCCCNDECLDEDMMPCSNGHLYYKECIQSASAIVINEGKT